MFLFFAIGAEESKRGLREMNKRERRITLQSRGQEETQESKWKEREREKERERG